MLFANLSGENGTAENCMIYNRAAKIQFMLLFWVFVLVGFWLGFFVSFGGFFMRNKRNSQQVCFFSNSPTCLVHRF